MSALNRFHETASDALEKISASLPAGAKLCLAIYTPEKPELDIVLQDRGLDLNEVVSTLRRRGLSIDGDNVYKRDLLDAVVGALALGAQNRNPPPSDHWGTRFWEIGREERELHEELVATLRESRQVIAMALKTGATDWFDTDEKISRHVTVQRIDAILAKAGA
ncbi:hypothetical protein [Pseudomonas sp. PB103]|uniref:hypothetical protein n=1 Tax=Pseudomonas sp. PB103 TaxID=2494698 RepID=UPI002113A5D1|nr:hypothetical protein [Pseudomonas sp. PB103]